ncbi:MAG: hypothetical protein WAN50_02975 [Minisyncoccia bacterium]
MNSAFLAALFLLTEIVVVPPLGTPKFRDNEACKPFPVYNIGQIDAHITAFVVFKNVMAGKKCHRQILTVPYATSAEARDHLHIAVLVDTQEQQIGKAPSIAAEIEYPESIEDEGF